MDRMIGLKNKVGPGGRSCSCCYPAPGKQRKIYNRSIKRAEKQAWKETLNEY